MKRIISVLSLVFLVTLIYAQNPKIELSVSSNQVSTADQFNLVLTFINPDGIKEYTPPNLTEFQTLSGPFRSSESRTEIINGKRKVVAKTIFTYKLRGKRSGTFKIGPITATGEKINLKSNTVTITVVKGASNGSQKQLANSNKNLFVAAEVTKRNVMVGEPVIVSYKIYLKKGNIRETEEIKIPQNSGFWKEEVDIEQVWAKKLINGVYYNVVEVQRHILFPQKSGELTIGSFEFSAIISTGGFFNHQNSREASKSSPVTIKVSPLPGGRPANYLGSFETLSLYITAKPEKLKAHEAIDYKVTFKGKGNLKLLNAPEITFPQDMEAYDPKVKDKIHVGRYVESGSRSFEYLVIPRSAGDFTIPVLKYSYFDYNTKQYKYLNAPQKNFTVLPNADEDNGNYTFNSKNEVNVISQDIRYIKTNADSLTKKGKIFFGSTAHHALLAFPLFLLLGFVLVDKRSQNIAGDPKAHKMKKAMKIASKHLVKAKNLIGKGDNTAFYQAISSALFGYLQDKFGIQMSEMSKENIRTTLDSKKVNSSTIAQLIITLETCDIARFAPVQSTSESEMYKQAEDVIRRVESGE